MKRTSPSCRSVSRAARSPEPHQHRARGDPQADTELGGHDAGQRGLAETRGAGEEQVVGGLVDA